MSAAGTAAAFGEVGIVDGKPVPRNTVDVINFGAVEMWIKLLRRRQCDAAEVVFRVDQRIELVVKVERVLHPTATAAQNAYPQERFGTEVLGFFNSLNFRRRRRSHCYHIRNAG